MDQVVPSIVFADPPAAMADQDVPMAGTSADEVIRSNGALDVDVAMKEDDAEIKETASPIFASYDGCNDDIVATKKGRKAPARATVRPAKRPKTDAWSVETLMQNPKSKLLKVNLKALLKDEQAWTSLDFNSQNKIIALLPENRRADFVTTIDGKHQLNQQLLMNNSSWNYFIGCVRDDIAVGRNKPAWLQDANTAYLERQVGKYDTWKEKEYEEFWGTKQKLAAGVIAGSSASLKWEDLIERGCFKPGDVFQYSRTVATGKKVSIKKDVELMEMFEDEKTGKHYMRCRFAAGERIIPKGTDEDLIRDDVSGPESLGRIAIAIHGGLKGQRIPNGNAWKCIRLIRKNQDLGTVWDVRQAVHFNEAESGPPAKKAKNDSEDSDEAYTNGRANGRSKRAKRTR